MADDERSRRRMAKLIKRSSLGTRRARGLRALINPSVVADVQLTAELHSLLGTHEGVLDDRDDTGAGDRRPSDAGEQPGARRRSTGPPSTPPGSLPSTTPVRGEAESTPTVPTAITVSTESGVRADLQRELEELRAEISGLTPDGDELSYDENFAVSGQIASERGEYRTLIKPLREQAAEIEHALAKVDAGTYGTCERCGQPIAKARLEALPATRYCIQHA